MSKPSYLTEEERKIAQEKQKLRTKIANTVRRYNIDNTCFSCGKKGKIIHNYEDPYNIAFLCDECKKDNNNIKKIPEYRVNIKNIIENNVKDNMIDQQVKRLSIEEIKGIVDEYLSSTKSIGEFTENKHISRHQFNTMIEMYDEAYKNLPVRKLVSNKTKRVQKAIVQKAKANQKLNNELNKQRISSNKNLFQLLAE